MLPSCSGVVCLFVVHSFLQLKIIIRTAMSEKKSMPCNFYSVVNKIAFPQQKCRSICIHNHQKTRGKKFSTDKNSLHLIVFGFIFRKIWFCMFLKHGLSPYQEKEGVNFTVKVIYVLIMSSRQRTLRKQATTKRILKSSVRHFL